MLSSVDISTAFLQADEFPVSDKPRYVVYTPYRGADPQVYRLRGSIYGCRRASMWWFKTLQKWMLQHKFKQSKNDPAVFVRDGLTVVCWVDDILCRGMRAESDAFYAELSHPKTGFDLKADPQYLSPDNQLDYVGLTITMREKGLEKYYYIDCEKDTQALLDASGIVAAKRVSSPMSDKFEMVSDLTPVLPEEVRWYKSMYGSISWFASTVRFDMAHTVHRLGQVMANPTRGAIKAMKRALIYMSQTAGFKREGPSERSEGVRVVFRA